MTFQAFLSSITFGCLVATVAGVVDLLRNRYQEQQREHARRLRMEQSVVHELALELHAIRRSGVRVSPLAQAKGEDAAQKQREMNEENRRWREAQAASTHPNPNPSSKKRTRWQTTRRWLFMVSVVSACVAALFFAFVEWQGWGPFAEAIGYECEKSVDDPKRIHCRRP